MRLLSLVIIFLVFSCRGEKRYEDLNLTDYQKQVNNFFKDASVSPLKTKDLKTDGWLVGQLVGGKRWGRGRREAGKTSTPPLL